MSRIDYEREYDNRGRVPEHPALIEGWYAAAAAFRRQHPAEFDRVYGVHPRETLDLFRPAGETAGAAMVFVHGGYWQALDKAGFSHLAGGILAHGLPVAIVGYPLCPEVTLGDIVDAVRRAILATFEATGRRVVVCGHSAGGHLAAAMLATNWTAAHAEAPADLVPSALAISGLFDLHPLTRTKINAALGLDDATAQAMSPLFWQPPTRRRFDAWLGAAESTEYHRQSRDIVRVWGEGGVDTEYEVVPGANHFTVVAPLADRSSPMTRRLVGFCREAAPLA